MEAFLDISNYNNIHFVGIGGVSMSSLALILKQKGKHITGSDSTKSLNTDLLMSNGIHVSIGHGGVDLSDTDLIVYTAAISDDNPELVYAKTNNIPMIERAILLGLLMTTYSESIAVSGTHGKTTTTSMLASIYLDANTDPTVLIGAHFNRIGANHRTGNSKYAIYEACEYVNSFHHFYPNIAIITNIDSDHLDFFKDLDDIKDSFLKFTQNINQNGLLVINGDDPNCRYIIDNSNRETVTFGFNESNDCCATNIKYESGLPKFDIIYKGELINDIKLSVMGTHNILNALSAVCVAKYHSIDNDSIIKGLLNFKGADRRFEIKKYVNGAAIVDDYAHHPTEIKATISSAKSAGFKKVTVIFQSHTYTRTKLLMNEFAAELSNADQVVITDIYSAREINTIGANIMKLKDMVPNSIYISDFNEIAKFIEDSAKPNEVYILMGAGNINSVANLL